MSKLWLGYTNVKSLILVREYLSFKELETYKKEIVGDYIVVPADNIQKAREIIINLLV